MIPDSGKSFFGTMYRPGQVDNKAFKVYYETVCSVNYCALGGFPARGSPEGWKWVKIGVSGPKRIPKTGKLQKDHIYTRD